jgi:Na+/proline symporter
MQPPNSPQYTYAALTLRFLPAGLMGLMIASMFSATMSTLSSDYNVMASVITEDIYRRLFNKNASQRQLVIVGRLATLFIGALTIAIGIILITSAQRGLFEVMVTVFGLFVGPMLIPMLLGLLIPRITWRGAAAGIVAGFASGLSFYLYKNYVLAIRPGIDANWLRYDFEAITILANFSITIGAMLLVTALEKATTEDRAKIKQFFTRLATPIDPGQTHAEVTGESFSPFYIIGLVTIGTGLLLMLAITGQPAGSGRAINLGSGVALCLIGIGFYRLHQNFIRGETAAREKAQRIAAAKEARSSIGK